MASADGERFDLIIRNGTLIDGTGAPRHQADLAITGGRIGAMGDLAKSSADRTLDASGRVVAPGFIDVHTHDDRVLLSDPAMTPKVSQGVTTVVVGNCGISLAPFTPHGRPIPPLDLLGDAGWYRFPTFGAFLDAVDRAPAAVNALFLVGHQTLRVGAMDSLERAATEGEIGFMRGQIDEAMRAGAVGFSTGLFYPPARHAPTDEVVALAEAVTPYGGLYATHLRDEGALLLDSVDEALTIGERAGLPVVLSHHKASGKANHGKVSLSLAKIDAAAKRQRVSLDVYPYNASSTVLLPGRLDDAPRILITWSEAIPEAAGRELGELAAEHGLTREDMAGRLLPAGAIYFAMAEADVQTVLRYPGAMIGSDGLPGGAKPHPRLWGTFPRVLGHYSRDLGLMPLEEAVHRMTGLSAKTFGLADRGVLRPGAAADIVIFDPATVLDLATFEAPETPARGIELVLVAGKPVWRNGGTTGERPGRALRRTRPI
ncbi:MAG: D-aminoacylase [Alphaproteobacteria bacterium]|nr:D-aminoacylase [Alphaproteobacteria bacterium]